MKSLNIKKLAAVGAGVALVAASVSGAAIVKSDIIDSTGEKLNVNGIYYGETSWQSDIDAANELAGVIATLAVSNDVKSVCEDKNVPKEGTGTYSFDKDKAKKLASDPLGTAVTGTFNYNQVDGLLNWTSSKYKVGSNETTTMRENLAFTASPFFNTDSDVGKMVAEIDGGDLNYFVEFSQGVDFNADGEWEDGDWIDTGASRKVEIPFLGQKYMVYRVSEDADEMDLFESNAVKEYKKGEKTELLKGKDGKDYYVAVDGVISGDDDEARLTLYTADGQIVDSDYENQRIGVNDKFAEDFLESMVYVTDIYDESDNADLRDWVVEMAVGKTALTLKDGEGFPYDSTVTDDEEYDWTTTLSFTGGTVLDMISLTTMGHKDYEDEEALLPGQDVAFYNDFARVKFVGLELPEFDSDNPKEVEALETYGAGLTYIDTDDVEHEIPFYIKLELTDLVGTSDATYYKGFTFDGVEYIAYVDSDANEVDIVEGSVKETDFSMGSAVAVDAYDEIAAGDFNAQTMMTTTFDLDNSEETAVTYTTVFDLDDEALWLLLDDTIATKYGTFDVVGTDAEYESGDFNATYDENAGDITFYVPKNSTFKKLVDFDVDNDGDTFTAVQFLFTDADSNTVTLYWNAESEKLVRSGDGGSDSVPFGGQALLSDVPEDAEGTLADLYLNRGDDDEITSGYNVSGTKATVTSDYQIEIVAPEEIPNAKFWVYTQEGSGELSGVEYETKNVCENKDVSTPYAGVPLVPMAAVESPAGNYIVIGGWYVNSLWPEELETLSAENTKLAEALNGNLYIAGWEAADTEEAVADVIKVLEGASEGEQ